MNHTFRILEFNLILEKLMEFAHTEAAKERISQLTPCLKEGEVKKSLRDTTEARTIIDRMGLPPAVSMAGLQEIISTAEQGGCLSAEELERTGGMLTAVKRYKEFLNRCKYLELGLPYYEQDLDPLEGLAREIYESVRNGKVEDSASKYLRNIRQDVARLEEKLRTKAEAILRGNKKYFSDSYVTIRNGRLCLPVKKDYKTWVPGSVIDQSSTGSTLFIEPAAIAELNGELELLRIEEENETRRILYRLTASVEDNLQVLEEDKRLLEKLDFLFAKGSLSASMAGIEPGINTDRIIKIVNGRHPFMAQETVVPLEFELGTEGRGIVITGPNTGGKTVAIKTVGLFALMAQCGLHVPCGKADLCMNSQVLCDIGDGQNITENLSTFSAHITNVMKILHAAGPESLVILDELGSGTDPGEGMGIAIAILEELRNSGCLFLATTHYPEVKTYAKETEGITNARMAFDKETLKPLYRLEIGEAGESCALSIAKRLGMPDSMIRKARRYAYGEEEGLLAEGTDSLKEKTVVKKTGGPVIEKQKKTAGNKNIMEQKFVIGDSVLVYPDEKKGIVCRPVNEKGLLQVQMPDKKIWINQKRVKLLVAAGELYPEDYDFSIIFDTVENRKARHKMEKGYQKDLEIRMD
ncbi:endonuclease MutS2 [Lacrimispora saccharolytica]|uniref:DNA mismatch repair protein MutS domain protein n=1 Tax=Lacrimispora saccharolytica (strain ATCC 35040 / DSM 2544 / NRCC 2533 / WM1) TaxID=610130 RepID=D9R7F8_LACSW|nr:DNA mismatch repair protein MutS [Lacrimispora saccharolytica]ADL03687.1 DNA mismatch repair protein MutS domain protein [[Clostridium] saccharolyticum WM1]QRV18176.1 DNA mismatch repair protein MutS [Lacrimispora saccharolytica]